MQQFILSKVKEIEICRHDKKKTLKFVRKKYSSKNKRSDQNVVEKGGDNCKSNSN